jgi:dephospho-CoA kinase
VIGVSGIMGAGKSTVARVFQGLGARLIDADTLGKDLLADKAVRAALIEAFGKAITGRRGEIDTRKLGQAAFADGKGALVLDRLTREPLIERIKAEIEKAKETETVIVVDAALLPEWDAKAWIDVLVVVEADQDKALERSCAGARFDEENVRARMKHQLGRKQKAQQADVIIPNFGSPEELRDRAEKVFWTLVGIA